MGKLLAGNARDSMNIVRNLHNIHKTYTVETSDGETHTGKITINNTYRKKLEFETDGYYVDIPYNTIISITDEDSYGGKRINYSTKKSKNRRHASRRRRTSKKHSGTKKHRRRRA
jgi:hypothetical protein